ncbi:hypothetical protein GGI12_001393 [Dipsacomyces acuminosporus]|nr:hypothetical protein GGI12_001393 [Dipsacomyces acuminosporus]
MKLLRLTIAPILFALAGAGSATGHSHFNQERPVLLSENTGTLRIFNARSTKPYSSSRAPYDRNKAISAAIGHVGSVYSLPLDTLRVVDTGVTQETGVRHIYMRQYIDGVEVINGMANANVDHAGNVISSGSTMANSTAVSAYVRDNAREFSKRDSLSALDALNSLLNHLDTGSLSAEELDRITQAATDNARLKVMNLPKRVKNQGPPTIKQVLVYNDGDGFDLAWHVTMQQTDNWWSAWVNQRTGKVDMLNDWYARSKSFRVYPYTINSPREGSRALLVNPGSKVASPKGWVYTNTTMGNNVWAQYNPSGLDNADMLPKTPESAPGAFDYIMDLSQEPGTYADASVIQLFYMVNIMHDLAYLYGFDEAAGNFQDTNFSGQGKGNDSVIAMAQDGSGTDNSSFATPPDGYRPIMRVNLWTGTNPRRDADLEADLLAHEYTHGITSRLTGGSSSADCLSTSESLGLSEGWSDIVAVILRTTRAHSRATNMVMGDYVTAAGIHRYAYSTNKTTNPTAYANAGASGFTDAHDIGSIWATMLYEAMWNFNDALGISDDLFKRELSRGNSLFLQLLIDSFKLQPCNPTFLSSRDALIQAEKNRTQGKYACLLWRAFAKRGLGYGARNDGSGRTNNYELPPGCATHLS